MQSLEAISKLSRSGTCCPRGFPSRWRVWCLALALASAACGNRISPSQPACVKDSDCGSDQICFADGCGDPGKDIRAEVTPNTQQGLYAQDFVLNSVEAQVNFNITNPTLIRGEITLVNSSTGASAPYSGLVSIHARGASTLIPGLSRVFESQVRPVQGAYSAPVGAGTYSVLVTPLTDNLPPFPAPALATVPSGGAVDLNVTFPSADSVHLYQGSLVRNGQPITDVAMQVQALDLSATYPLSQSAKVSSGSLDATGKFTLTLAPGATTFILEASPSDPASLIPTKDFSVTFGSSDQFDLGQYGDPVHVTGVAVSSSGAPIAGAAVYLDGPVQGGGRLRTASVFTDSSGAFVIMTLVNSHDSRFSLWIVPPPQNDSGILHTAIQVLAATPLGTVKCPDRVVVTGLVRNPDGSVASGIRVTAQPVAPLANAPLPAANPSTTTDSDGSFALKLDPALYRLDFLPSESLPRASHYIGVQPPNIDLGTITLSNGRHLMGMVTSSISAAGSDASPIAFASVRLFRLASVNDLQTSVLLSETVCDANGNYSAVLPAR